MLQTFLLNTADTPLGRIDQCDLTPQQKMELLVADLSNADKERLKFHNTDGMFDEVRNWRGVYVNFSREPLRIRWSNISGTIALDFITDKVTYFIVQESEDLEGTLNTATLPESLRELILYDTSLSGSVDLENLPRANLTNLNLSLGKFSGTLNLAELPPKSKNIFLHENSFTGSVDLSHLPQTMQELSLESNQLSGEVDLSNLPPTMRRLILSKNHFCGEFRILKAPQDLRVNASSNDFSGVAIVERAMHEKVLLSNTNVEKIVDEDGEQYAEE